MTDYKRQEIMRFKAEGMRAMSNEEMARRQLEDAYGACNASADYAEGQANINNFWSEVTDAMPIVQLPPKPRPTLWACFKRWIRA